MFKFKYYGEYYEDIISNEKQTLHWKKGNARNEGIILVTVILLMLLNLLIKIKIKLIKFKLSIILL